EIASNIPKPINMQGLLETVKEIISNRRKTVLQTRKRIAILDDEARSQQFLQSILVHDMYDIETFISEKELLKRHRHKVFDLYIIDLPSAGKKFGDIIQNIKELSANAVFLTITPDDYEVSQEDMDKQDIHAHYTKPIDINNFRTNIDSLLEKSNKDEQIETEQEEAREDQEDESKDSQVDINDESEEAVEVDNG
ncbi:response regulator, partial [Candidatus Poribacteria bacterium]|nr:response regulator [Candidatus Poribacteria bacterium]